MYHTIEEIESQIECDNEKTLQSYLDFVYRCRTRESDRGRTAETRAIATLAVVGVLVGLLIPQFENLPQLEEASFWFLTTSYGIPLFFLLLSAIYAMRVISASKTYRIEAEAILEENLTTNEALRYQIALITWECNYATSPNSKKLLSLDRSQRFVLFAVFTMVVFGISMFLSKKLDFYLPACVGLIYLVTAVIASIIERWFVLGNASSD